MLAQEGVICVKNRKRGRFLKESRDFSAIFQGLFWFGALLYWEVLLHIGVFGGIGGKFLYALGFTAPIGLLLGLVLSFVPRKAGFWTDLAVSLVLAVLYGSQLVYHFIFGTLYSVGQMGLGGAAVTNFWRETLSTIWDKLPVLLLLFLPTAVRILLQKLRPGMLRGEHPGWRPAMAAAAVAVQLVELLCLNLGDQGRFSDYDYYYGSAVATNRSAERFGLLTTMRREIFGGSGRTKEEAPQYYVPETPAETQPRQEASPEQTLPEEKPLGYNVLDIDFDALSALTEDEKILALNNYCAQLSGTRKNEYTGLLADYNLILLCGESFSTAAIQPEVTPTLYKLANEGIVFTNFYNSFPNTTTNGEYTLLQGLYPDTSRSQEASSMLASRNNYLPFTLGNAFAQQRGIASFGYHNYNGQYFGRAESHPNLGSTMKFAGDGMEFTTNWPASDLEMMEQSVDDYIGQEQFHAYYMTFSGHYKYDKTVNTMAARNWDEVQSLPYSAPARAYLSCNIELDKALEYLLQRLEEAGIADKTAIVLSGDHFPYGLQENQYEELVGHDVDDFTKFKSTLIFWVGGLQENIVVEDYCCNADILPTILNLWGLEYDSRMLAGNDVFSDGTHVAVLSDRSFVTDKVRFSSRTGKAEYLVPEDQISEGYVENLVNLVDTRFRISTDILNTDYYRFVFEEGEVSAEADGRNG